MSLEQRVFAHYKSLKRPSSRTWVKTKQCGWLNNCKPGTEWVFFPHSHGYDTLTTPNEDWLRLARVHKIPVRQVKDIVTAERNRRRDNRLGTDDSNAADHRSR